MMRTFRFDLPACFMTRACLHILFVFMALFTLVLGQTALAQSVREDTTGLRASPPLGEEDPPYNYAQMILQDVPREMVTGRLYDVSISMRNTGTTIWYGASGAYKLGSYAPQGNMTWGLDRVRLTTSVTGVGNTGKFDFQVRAPSIPGVYNFQWQMLQEGVEWFGAPSYPIAITVRDPINNAQPAGQSVTTQMQGGERYNVSVTMVNNGETTWNWGQQYTLMSQSPHNNTTWGNNRVPLPVDNIAPGQSVTFNFPVTAPSSAGSYVMQWGMQREGYGSFGPGTTPVTINVVAPYNDAQVVSVSVPARMQSRQSYNVAVTMRNNGTTTWTPGAHYNLGSQNTPLDQIWGLNRVSLASPVAPGQQYTFNFSVTAPVPEYYTMHWRMVQDGVEWFGGTTANQIKVTEDLSRVTFIHTDGLGSPVARTDGNGNLVSRTRYEPYGHVASGATPTIGFTGHVNDADTGLTYMQQRYYDPVAGRFLSIDPVVTDANTGGSFNRYAYANNSPYKYIDPDGRDSTVKDGVIKIEPKDPTVPRITLPNTVGATGISSSSITFHTYDVKTSSNLTNAAAVGNGIANSPTPGLGNLPASPAGTVNNAGGIPTAGNTNLVKSFAVNTPDANKFTNITVNYTVSNGHGLAEGFVIRYGEISPSNGTITLHSYGEGNNWRQAEALKGIWGPQVERVWGNNQQSIINGIQ